MNVILSTTRCFYDPKVDKDDIIRLKEFGFNFTKETEGLFVGTLRIDIIEKELNEMEIIKFIKEIASEVVLDFYQDSLDLEIYNEHRE
jgi:hypothetical protein